VHGTRHSVIGADGTSIGLLTAGAGPALLLVHGGMGRLEGWGPIWPALAERRLVTAMDRRGRGSSGDTEPYTLSKEFDDIAAVATRLAEEQGALIDVFAHSYGTTWTLGAAAHGAPFRRIALYEPPGPQAVPREWVERATALVSDGKTGRDVQLRYRDRRSDGCAVR
jgi:pimeloyl-ACP methyl ester carboxylesterase